MSNLTTAIVPLVKVAGGKLCGTCPVQALEEWRTVFNDKL